jgi:excinuclease UvrABC ATPase subunit
MSKKDNLIFKNYLALVTNSVGSRLFKNHYLRMGRKTVDIMRDGDVSCAYFVSSTLVLATLMSSTHATVASTVKDLEKSGWKRIQKPKVGSILVWEEKEQTKGDPHKHIGFYMGKNQAISNDFKRGVPAKHHYTYGGKRNIEAIYGHPRF